MFRGRPLHRSALAASDVALVLWTLAWVGMGLAVAGEVRGLAELSDTVGSVGRAVTSTGETIRELPLIGDQVAGPAGEVSEAGREAIASAESARESARRVGVLLGVSIALIPTLPLLGLYLPARIGGARERRALRRAVAAGREPWLDEALARRAVANLPIDRLLRASDDPGEDLRAGRHRELADAELEWFGVRPAARRRVTP